MKIVDVLQKEAIQPNLKARDKKGILEELVAPLAEAVKLPQEELVRILLERERLGSTGIGGGIGIPHGKVRTLEALVLGVGISQDGVSFESLDGRPTYIFFVLITPENSTGEHLKMLARISRILKNDPFKQRLMNANDIDEIYRIIEEEDQEV